jgi:hypothetical protein
MNSESDGNSTAARALKGIGVGVPQRVREKTVQQIAGLFSVPAPPRRGVSTSTRRPFA